MIVKQKKPLEKSQKKDKKSFCVAKMSRFRFCKCSNLERNHRGIQQVLLLYNFFQTYSICFVRIRGCFQYLI